MSEGNPRDSNAPANAAPEYLDDSTYVMVEGAELYAELVGPATAPAVYYLHGGPGYSSHSFRELMADDLEAWRMVYADVRGGGRSYAAAGTSGDLPTLADDVTAIMDTCEVESAVLLGHGFGAMIAVQAALDHPERVTGLVLVNPWLSLPVLAERLLAAAEAASGLTADLEGDGSDDEVKPPTADAAATADAAFSLMNPKALFDALQFPTATSRLRLEHVDAEALLGPQEEDETDAVWGLEVVSRLPELAALGTQVIVIAGEQDGTSYPEQVEAALALLPDALFSALSGGHYPWLDDPETFTDVLHEALRRETGPKVA